MGKQGLRHSSLSSLTQIRFSREELRCALEPRTLPRVFQLFQRDWGIRQVRSLSAILHAVQRALLSSLSSFTMFVGKDSLVCSRLNMAWRRPSS